MTLLCLASQKGSPGVSAAAIAVAAALEPGPDRRKLLLEADLSGGVLAVRYQLPPNPGLVTLAAAARAGLDDDELWRHTVSLPGGLPAVVGGEGPDQVHSALAAAGSELGGHLAERSDLDVICDLGRLVPGSPAIGLAAEATALLMVARPSAEQLQPAARRLLALQSRIRYLGWLLVGERPHGPAEVEATFGFPVVGVLADDQRSVEAIESGVIGRRVRRQPFVRSAATVADTLSQWLWPLTEPAGGEPVDTDTSDVDTADLDVGTVESADVSLGPVPSGHRSLNRHHPDGDDPSSGDPSRGDPVVDLVGGDGFDLATFAPVDKDAALMAASPIRRRAAPERPRLGSGGGGDADRTSPR